MKVKHCVLIKPLMCGKEAPLTEAAKILRENKQRRIVVVDDKEYPVGIISTTDMNNRVVAEGADPKEIKAADVMTDKIYFVCDVEDDLSTIHKKMLEKESFFVPVTRKKKLYAILTYAEIIRQVQELINSGS